MFIGRMLFVALVVTLLGVPAKTQPQRGSGQSGKQSSGNQGGGGGGQLAGLSYTRAYWDLKLTLPDTSEKAVICYKVVQVNSAAQPLVLQPTTIFLIRPDGSRWTPCTTLDEKHPLLMRQLLVVGIDASGMSTERLKLLNINVTNQQGVPINPNPIRPSFGSSSSTAASLAGGVYFLTWPNALPGDNIPTVSVNTVYTPPLPGARWASSTFYPAGSVVTSSANNGHYYTALSGGVSGQNEPGFPANVPPTVNDGTVVWLDSGTSLPAGQTARQWLPGTAYALGTVVAVPATGHSYTAMQQGTSGAVQPPFPMTAMTTVTEAPAWATVNEGTVVWRDLGPASGGTGGPWTPNHDYATGDIVANPANGRLYAAVNSGRSGSIQPNFPITSTLPIIWQDSGTTVPAAVASGQPADQVVNLLSFTLPQVHSLYYYNLSSGVVVSSIHNRSFVFVPSSPGSSTNIPVKVAGSPIVDPVLLFTVYPKPIDAESRYHAKDLIPGISFGLSLSSPASNFYFGGSSEILRNVQLVYGFTVAKVSKLAPSGTIQSSTSSPATTQVFEKGAFVGVTYNISGFLQGLFGGGGKGQ